MNPTRFARIRLGFIPATLFVSHFKLAVYRVRSQPCNTGQLIVNDALGVIAGVATKCTLEVEKIPTVTARLERNRHRATEARLSRRYWRSPSGNHLFASGLHRPSTFREAHTTLLRLGKLS